MLVELMHSFVFTFNDMDNASFLVVSFNDVDNASCPVTCFTDVDGSSNLVLKDDTGKLNLVAHCLGCRRPRQGPGLGIRPRR